MTPDAVREALEGLVDEATMLLGIIRMGEDVRISDGTPQCLLVAVENARAALSSEPPGEAMIICTSCDLDIRACTCGIDTAPPPEAPLSGAGTREQTEGDDTGSEADPAYTFGTCDWHHGKPCGRPAHHITFNEGQNKVYRRCPYHQPGEQTCDWDVDVLPAKSDAPTPATDPDPSEAPGPLTDAPSAPKGEMACLACSGDGTDHDLPNVTTAWAILIDGVGGICVPCFRKVEPPFATPTQADARDALRRIYSTECDGDCVKEHGGTGPSVVQVCPCDCGRGAGH